MDFQDETSLALESFVDTFGLESVLIRLSDIAHGKAEHVASNWQDLELSKAWDKAGNVIAKLSDAIPESCR